MKALKITSIMLLAGCLSASAFTPVGRSGLKHAPTNRFVRNHKPQPNGISPSSLLKMQASGGQTSGARRITAGGTNLYGYLNFFGTPGLYEFNSTGFTQKWTDPTYEDAGGFDAVYYNHGKICALYPYVEYYGGEFFFEGVTYYEMDFNTGKITSQKYIEDFWMDYGYFINLAYDADNDEIYGYATYDEDGTTACFMKTKGTNPQFSDYVKIKDYGTSNDGFYKQCYSMCWNQIDGLLYGINLNNQVVTIDKTTGDQTVIMTIPKSVPVPSPGGQFISGMAYSPSEDVYYWECQYDNVSGNPAADLYTIDLNTKTFTKVENIPGAEGFVALWVVGDNLSAQAPKRPVIDNVEFSGASLSGTISATMPSMLMNATPITGDITWNLTANGAALSSGKVAAGSKVSIPVTVGTSGNYTFQLTATYNGVTSAPASHTMYLGSDRPKAPANVTLNPTTYYLYWSKVTEGVTGGYIDTSNLEYEVYLNGKLQGTTKTNTYQIVIPQDLPYGEVSASVIAVVNGTKSTPGYSNVIMAGAPWKLPVDMLCNEDNLKYVTIKDVNNDEWTWTLGWGDYWYSFQVDDDATEPGDDWIILPPVEFPDADAYYSFSIGARKHAGNLYPNTWMEVKYGPIPDPALMDEVILAPWEPQIRDFFTYTNPMFKVPQAGTWYIGIRCVTAPGELGCDIDRIRIEANNYDLDGPGECTNVSLESTTQTSLDANVTFTFPTETLAKATIPATTEITAVLTCGANKVTATGKPGETKTVNIATEQGANTIFIQCFIGDKRGASSQYELYTGEVIPGYVWNLKGETQADMMSVNLSWDPPTPWVSGIWEGGVNPETTWYNIVLRADGGQRYDFVTPKGATQYTVTLPAGAPQDIYTIYVQSENVAGNNGSYMDLRDVLGTPYTLPMKGGFGQSGQFENQPWVNYSPSGSKADWTVVRLENIATEWAGRKNYALVGFCTENTTNEGILGLPRFSTKDEDEVTITMTYYAGVEAADLTVKGSIYGMANSQSIFSWYVTGKDNPDEFRNISGKLPASMLGQDWVQLYLDAYFGNNAHYAIITSLNILSGDDSGVILTMDDKGYVSAMTGAIEIQGYEGLEYLIADTAGIVYSKGRLTGEKTQFAVPQGIYIVTIDGKTYKLKVK